MKQNSVYNLDEAITPLDGRNRHKLQSLIPYFSELGLFKYRIFVEIKYLLKLSEHNIIEKLNKKEIRLMLLLYEEFNTKEYFRIKEIENKINHDVKAVEYYLRDKFSKTSLKKLIPFIHLGLTSEDTNNLAYGLILNNFQYDVVNKLLTDLLRQIKDLAIENKDVVFLGRTHGQPAVPTTIGKELANYYYRIQKQTIKLKKFQFEGKCNGAVGNYNALQFTYPQINWIKFSQNFVLSLGLIPNNLTTQILFYDNYIEFFQIVQLINGILIDLCMNIWQYIMLEIFVQKKEKDQVGSSTMPQKINPIRFEHAEGSLQVANSLFEMYLRKLIVSRLQRDLSDSAVRRTFSEAFGYTILGWDSLIKGLHKISVNKQHIKEELLNHWEILSEALQVYLRSTKDPSAYEKVKEITQGKKITQELYLKILKTLKLDKNNQLLNLTPETYIGLAKKLTDLII